MDAVDTLQGEDVFPIPGTKRVKYLEQNVEAYHISKTLTKEELAELEAAVPKHEVRMHGYSSHSTPCERGNRGRPANPDLSTLDRPSKEASPLSCHAGWQASSKGVAAFVVAFHLHSSPTLH